MSHIYVVLNAQGNVTWHDTERIVRQVLNDEMKDFGAGSERAAKCPGCNRTLPTAILSLDHILPQARFTQSLMAPTTKIRVIDDTTLDISMRYQATVQGGVATITEIRAPHVTASGRQSTFQGGNILTNRIQTAELWRNDLRNLQWSCSGCNSTKNNRTWIEWKGDEVGAEPLHKRLYLKIRRADEKRLIMED